MAKITIKNDEPKTSRLGVMVFENGAPKKFLGPGESVKQETTGGKIITLAEGQVPVKAK